MQHVVSNHLADPQRLLLRVLGRAVVVARRRHGGRGRRGIAVASAVGGGGSSAQRLEFGGERVARGLGGRGASLGGAKVCRS